MINASIEAAFLAERARLKQAATLSDSEAAWQDLQSFDHDVNQHKIDILNLMSDRARLQMIEQSLCVLIDKNITILTDERHGFSVMNQFIQDFKDLIQIISTADGEFLRGRYTQFTRKDMANDSGQAGLPSGAL